MNQQFEWDSAKAAENLKKHRVDFAEALTVYGKLGVKCWICKGETKPEKPKAPEPIGAAS